MTGCLFIIHAFDSPTGQMFSNFALWCRQRRDRLELTHAHLCFPCRDWCARRASLWQDFFLPCSSAWLISTRRLRQWLSMVHLSGSLVRVVSWGEHYLLAALTLVQCKKLKHLNLSIAKTPIWPQQLHRCSRFCCDAFVEIVVSSSPWK